MFCESFDFNRVCSSVTDLRVTGWERLCQPNPTSSPLSQGHLIINPNRVAMGFDVGNETRWFVSDLGATSAAVTYYVGKRQYEDNDGEIWPLFSKSTH